MALRCLLFTADERAAEPICQVLAGLGVEAEHCSDAVTAVEKVTSQPFQIVIIDWDAQPEAALLLSTARERKASERPLTLAIVSDDVSLPKALQAGANSILRKPIIANHVKDTLTTARDLLRAKQESATTAAMAAAAGASAGTSSIAATSFPANSDQAGEKTLRAGEFLQSSGTVPGAHFETDSDIHRSMDHAAEPVDPLQDLEPVAASVSEKREEKPAPLPPPAPGETRGLQWYLNARAAAAPQAPAPTAPAPAPAKPELLAFDQSASSSYSDSEEPAASSQADNAAWAPTPKPSALPAPRHDPEHEQKAEAKLFAYISGEEEESEEKPRRTLKLGKPIVAALLLAACAVVAAPQAPWHPQMQALWGHGRQSLHAWLNPQPVTTAPAPASHESFGRAGDEYKLPVAENIPDATTDPSQIRVVPIVDPTAKKPTGANPDPNAATDPANTNPTDAPPPAGTQGQENQPQGAQSQQSQAQQSQPQPDQAPGGQSAPETAPPASQPPASTAASPAVTTAAPVATEQPHSDPPISVPVATQPALPKNPQPRPASTPANVPSSLKSQMASMTPDASGNKPPEAAMQSIEPVVVPEAAERALLADQPAIDYPANARGQQGTVILQVLIGRDGSVQDAKFLQGSLAFARTAIDGVKLWKFKPYSMNGRAVSVQTTMTMAFKPGS
jgi:protein TonB